MHSYTQLLRLDLRNGGDCWCGAVVIIAWHDEAPFRQRK